MLPTIPSKKEKTAATGTSGGGSGGAGGEAEGLHWERRSRALHELKATGMVQDDALRKLQALEAAFRVYAADGDLEELADTVNRIM